MCGPLSLLALLLGVAEYWIGSKIAAHLGTGDTIFLLLCSCGAGLWLCKKLGAHALRGSSAFRDVSQLPKEALLFFIAGALFLFPGFASDALGYLLLIKPCRPFLSRFIPQNPLKSSIIQSKTARDRDIDDPSVIVVKAKVSENPEDSGESDMKAP